MIKNIQAKGSQINKLDNFALRLMSGLGDPNGEKQQEYCNISMFFAIWIGHR